MRIDRQFVARLPVLACAGFIALMFLIQIWNTAVEREWPKLRVRSADAPPYGVEAPTPIPRGLDALLSGEMQKVVARNVGLKLPVFPISVRAKNQFLLSLFGVAGSSAVVVGREGQLLEPYYIKEYCRRRGVAPDENHLRKTAARLARIQAYFETQGKRFAYLISPSKVARYPQYTPDIAYCPARDGAFVDRLVYFEQALADAKVRVISGAAIIRDRQKDFDMPLFPQGGIHWNNLGAALALRDMTAAWRADGASPIGDYDFTWKRAPIATVGPDRDLMTMMNLLWPDFTYPTPEVSGAGRADCRGTQHVVALGSSFLHELLAEAAQAPCPPEIDYWFYMRKPDGGIQRKRFHRAPGAVPDDTSFPADHAAWTNTIAAADAVILEENESNLFNTTQLDDMRAHFDAPGDASVSSWH